MDLPQHPDTEDAVSTQFVDRESNLTTRIVIGVVVALVVIVVVLHLTGVVGPLAK
jgi:hypothetical protein